MKAVEGRLAQLVCEIVQLNQQTTKDQTLSAVPGVPLSVAAPRGAANDSEYVRERTIAAATFGFARFLLVFFAVRAKNSAKFAHNSLQIAKHAVSYDRRRRALAACFFAFFSLFPSHTYSANLSTTP